MIIPAHVPEHRRAAAVSARSGSASPSRSIPSVITVDSPPGMISASSPSRSAGTRTSRGRGTQRTQDLRVRLEAALEGQDPDDLGGPASFCH